MANKPRTRRYRRRRRPDIVAADLVYSPRAMRGLATGQWVVTYHHQGKARRVRGADLVQSGGNGRWLVRLQLAARRSVQVDVRAGHRLAATY